MPAPYNTPAGAGRNNLRIDTMPMPAHSPLERRRNFRQVKTDQGAAWETAFVLGYPFSFNVDCLLNRERLFPVLCPVR